MKKKKINKKEALEKLTDLISSCKSAKKEEWDFLYDENWDSMIEHLKEVEEFIGEINR